MNKKANGYFVSARLSLLATGLTFSLTDSLSLLLHNSSHCPHIYVIFTIRQILISYSTTDSIFNACEGGIFAAFDHGS